MQLRDTIRTAGIGLRTNRTRSVLTMLGIVIGVTSIILVMAIGRVAQNLILEQVQGLGSRTMFVAPGRDPGASSSFNFSMLYLDALKKREIDALLRKDNVPTLLDLSPMVFHSGVVSYADEAFVSNIVGSSGLFVDVLDVRPELGSYFTEDDIRQYARVAVIGSEVREKLFGENDPVGTRMKISGQSFRVIGVFPPRGRVGVMNIDDMVTVPYTVAQKYLTGQDHFNEIVVRAATEADVDRTKRDIEATLRELHGITDPEKDDFHVHTQADIADRIGIITDILTAVLAAVAGISLVVGGIGIMNMMLVSVTERTREIGLRKAIGATERDITRQFLLEAVLLTGLGGVLGLLLGALLSLTASFILSRVLDIAWRFDFPILAVVLGIGVSGIIGLVFGLYPARLAARKHPIEALRYE